jgi:hypothetical protein
MTKTGLHALQDYKYKGKLHGAFYDARGQPTELVQNVAEGTERARLARIERQNRRATEPSCSKRWSQDTGADHHLCVVNATCHNCACACALSSQPDADLAR